MIPGTCIAPLYMPKQVEKFWTPPLYDQPLVHFDIVYTAMMDEEEDVEKHFVSVTGRSGGLKSLVLLKEFQQDIESWGWHWGDFSLNALKAMLDPFLKGTKAVINVSAGPNVTYLVLVSTLILEVSFSSPLPIG